MRRYFLSVYEKNKKIAENKYEAHKKECRKNGRGRDVSTLFVVLFFFSNKTNKQIINWDSQ